MESTETLAGLEVLRLGHRERFQAAVAEGQQNGWAYYFPYLLTKSRRASSALLWHEDEGSVCLFSWSDTGPRPRMDLYFPPMPFDASVLRRCFERLNDFNGDRSGRILRIDEKDAPAVGENAALKLRQRRTQYLYDPKLYRELGGRRMRTVRRQVASFEEIPDVEIVPYAVERADDCRTLLRRWKSAHRAQFGTAGGTGGTRRVIELAPKLSEEDLRGELVYWRGRLVAFAFGGVIRPGLACFFDAKSDADVPGLGYAHRRSFLLSLEEFDRVNDGSDTGRPGLRQLKDSFRPVSMHAEYRATQRGTRRS